LPPVELPSSNKMVTPFNNNKSVVRSFPAASLVAKRR
jgi:hypothetical protein